MAFGTLGPVALSRTRGARCRGLPLDASGRGALRGRLVAVAALRARAPRDVPAREAARPARAPVPPGRTRSVRARRGRPRDDRAAERRPPLAPPAAGTPRLWGGGGGRRRG